MTTVTFTQETLFAGAVRAIGSTLSVSDQDAQMLVDLGAATAPGLSPQIGSVAGALISGFAPLVSPALSGTPTAPTATAGTNTTQIATTAFVRTNNNVKAWVNFNGTGTVAIRASFNVSSITDNGTGEYTINFSTALSDANYAVSNFTGDSTFGLITSAAYVATSSISSSSFRFKVGVNGSYYDAAYILMTFIR